MQEIVIMMAKHNLNNIIGGGFMATELVSEDEISEWYKIAKSTAGRYVPAADREDVMQEIVLALLRQRGKGIVNPVLTRVIARRVVFAYWNRARHRRIEDRSYRPILFFIRPVAVALNEQVTAVIPLGGSEAAEIAIVDSNFELVEDQEVALRLLELIPPRLLPVVERWLDPNRREALSPKHRQALHRLWKRLREKAG